MLPLASVAALARLEPRLLASANAISVFLDGSATVSSTQAIAIGNAGLLQRVLTRARAEADEPLAFERWVWTTLEASLRSKAKLAVVQVLATFIHPSRSLADAIPWAIEAHDLEATQWLVRRVVRVDIDPVLRDAIASVDLPIVEWLLAESKTISSVNHSHTKTKTRAIAKKRAKSAVELSATTKGAMFTSEMTDTKWQIVDRVVEELGVVVHRSIPILAAKHDRLDTLRKIKQHTPTEFTSALANAAAASGHFKVVEYIGVTPTTQAMDDAALAGDLAIIQQIHARYALEPTAVSALRAADQGHVHVLQWLYATFPACAFWTDLPGLVKPAIVAATEACQLDALQWLYTTLFAPIKHTLEDPHILSTETVYLAVRDKLEVVQLLFRNGLVNWDEWESRNATYYAGVDTLVWMNDNGLMRDPDNELQNAVYGGRMDCVKWVLANRPRGTNTWALEAAAMNSRVDMLELLIENGFTGSVRAVDYAAARGNLEAIKMLHRHRRSDGCSVAAMHGACLAGHLDVVKFLSEYYTDEPAATCTTTAMDSAASKNYLHIVEFLHTHRTEGCTTAAMDSAAANGHVEVVQFLAKHRAEGCTVNAVEGAATSGHFEVVRFLVDQYPHLMVGNTRIIQRARAKGEVEIASWLEQRQQQQTQRPATPLMGSCSSKHLETAMPPSPIRV